MSRRNQAAWIVGTLTACSGGAVGDPVLPQEPAVLAVLAAPSDLEVGELAGGAHVTWKDLSDDEERFELERRDGEGAFLRLATVPFDAVQYHDATVVPGERYRYRVRAAAAGRVSTFSSEVEFSMVLDTVDGGVTTPDSGVIPADVDAGVPTAPSFRADVVPIFVRSCGTGEMSCHASDAYAGNPTRDCRGWLSLVDRPLGSANPVTGAPTGCPDRTLYQRLIELDAWMCNSPRRYVVPGDVDGSRLYELIAGDPSGGNDCFRAPNVPQTPMPPSSSRFTISMADRQILAGWIAAGAPNN